MCEDRNQNASYLIAWKFFMLLFSFTELYTLYEMKMKLNVFYCYWWQSDLDNKCRVQFNDIILYILAIV